MNKRTISLILFVFIFINAVVYEITKVNANQRIDTTLKQNLQKLKTHYEILLGLQRTIALTIYDATIHDKFVIDAFSKARYASKAQQKILRDKVYAHLTGIYKRAKMQGVLQYQLQFPDNVTFLRMHKPSKFGDNLTNIRRDYDVVNKTLKPLSVFSQGRSAHGFRNTFPVFDANGKHIGAMEVSFPSEYFQEHLTEISHIHTHFIVSKKIYETKAWKRDDLILKYQQSAESPNYMITMTNNDTKEKDIIETKKTLQPIRDKINAGLKKGKEFSIFTNDIDNDGDDDEVAEVISFVPIQDIYNKTVAWLVSYGKSKYIQYTINSLFYVRGFTLLFSLIIAYFMFRQQLLLNKLKEKTTIIKNENQIKELYMNTINTVILVLDKDGNITMINKTGYEILGFTYEDLIGKNWFEIGVMPNEILLEVKEYFQKIIKGNMQLDKLHYENKLLTSKGEELIFSWTNSILESDGEIIGLISAGINITNERKQEEIINQQSKLASMGEMIGNIAHQWRQPLSVISTGSTGMKLQKEFGTLSDEQFMKTCDLINDNAQYLSKTIDDFRNFIKGDRKQITFKLSDNIKSFLHIVEGNIKNHNIKIIENLDDKITINGYPNELVQCLINIFNNSKDAFKEKEINKKFFFIFTSLKDNKITITLKDNAGGIPQDVLPKIFEPYFTTKHQSQGTGLGLHMTYNIITDGMNSSITAQNVNYTYKEENYVGAEFTIMLPLS